MATIALSDKKIDSQQLVDEGFAWMLESTFLNQLDAVDRDQLLGLMEWRSYDAGRCLVEAGKSSGGMELIAIGEAEVVLPSGKDQATLFNRTSVRKANGETVAARLAPGHVYGERSLRKGLTANATVRALSPMRTLHMAAADFVQATVEIPAFSSYIDGLVALRERAAEVTDLLLRHPFLRLLGRDDIQRFVESGRIDKFGPHTPIVRLGDQTTDAYVVIRGRVGVMAGKGAGREIVATKGPGWMFGHAAALFESPRTADIDALEPTELLRVRAEVLMGLVTRNPALFRQLFRELSAAGVTVRSYQPTAASLTVIYGTRKGLGTTAVAFGLAGALALHYGAQQRDPPQDWPACQVVLVDMRGAATAQRMNLRTQRVAIDGMEVGEIVTAGGAFGVRVLFPPEPGATMALVERLRGQLPAQAWLLVAGENQDSINREVLHAAQSVVLVRGADDGAHEEAAERHHYRVDAVRLTGAPLPLHASGRTVRLPDDAESLRNFYTRGELSALAQLSTPFGRACGRLARALLGRTVGLALGGGGALGFAHIGLLRALEEANIPVDYIAGVSFGSLVAGLYAAGRRDAIERCVKERLGLIPPLLAGFGSTAPFEWYVNYLTGGEVKMSQTEIPFYPVGVDIHTGREVVRAHGSVGHGVRSSSCLPGAYPSLVIGGQRIVDGGMHNNVPASVTWQSGAHFIIASNIIPEFPFAPPAYRPGLASLLRGSMSRVDDLMRSMFLLMSQSGRDRAQLADYVFDLELRNYNIYDFAKGDQIAAAGYEQAHAAMDDIRAAWNNQGTGSLALVGGASAESAGAPASGRASAFL